LSLYKNTILAILITGRHLFHFGLLRSTSSIQFGSVCFSLLQFILVQFSQF